MYNHTIDLVRSQSRDARELGCYGLRVSVCARINKRIEISDNCTKYRDIINIIQKPQTQKISPTLIGCLWRNVTGSTFITPPSLKPESPPFLTRTLFHMSNRCLLKNRKLSQTKSIHSTHHYFSYNFIKKILFRVSCFFFLFPTIK